MALQALRSAEVRVTLGQAELALAEESLRQITKAFELGTSSQIEIIDAEDQVSVARLRLLQSELDRDLSAARLARFRPDTPGG
jgi:outer membrane protein TolC